MPLNATELRELLTRRNICYGLVFVTVILFSIGIGGLYMLFMRAVIIGFFVLNRVRYRPRGEDESPQTEPQEKAQGLRLQVSGALDVVAWWKGVGEQVLLWRAALRSLTPATVPHLFLMIICYIAFHNPFWRVLSYSLPSVLPVTGYERELMVALGWLPVTVLLTVVTNRSVSLGLPKYHSKLTSISREIVDSRSYHWPSPRSAFAQLFSTTEKARPSVLLRLPLLPMIIAGALRLCIALGSNYAVNYCWKSMDSAIYHWQEEPEPEDQLRAAFDIALEAAPYVLPIVPIKLLAVMLVCPLEVAVTRLSVQRHRPDVDEDVEAQPELKIESPHNEADGFKPVIPCVLFDPCGVLPLILYRLSRLREQPYTGLWDCLSSICKEEGWGQLYRGWWATLAFTAHGMSWESNFTGWVW